MNKRLYITAFSLIILISLWYTYQRSDYEQIIRVTPLQQLKLGTVLSSVYGFPCDQVMVLGGKNMLNGVMREDIKDWLEIRKQDITVDIKLFESTSQALDYYELSKTTGPKVANSEESDPLNRYYITTINRLSDRESIPGLKKNVYISKVVFLKQNVTFEFLQTSTNSDTTQKEKMIEQVAMNFRNFLNK